MSDKEVSLENLYKLRGDVAIAALEGMIKETREAVEAMTAVLKQLQDLDAHYQLRRNLNLDGMGEMMATIRRMNPQMTEGKTDSEILELFGRSE